jgi:hypothetical protein
VGKAKVRGMPVVFQKTRNVAGPERAYGVNHWLRLSKISELKSNTENASKIQDILASLMPLCENVGLHKVRFFKFFHCNRRRFVRPFSEGQRTSNYYRCGLYTFIEDVRGGRCGGGEERAACGRMQCLINPGCASQIIDDDIIPWW